jgi:hypothetical protein
LAALAAHDLRWRAWKPAATFAAPVLSWVLAATAYFGTPWPRSLAVKANASTLAAYAAHEAMCPLEDLLPLTGLLPMPCGIAFWTLAGCGWWLAVRRSARLLVLPAWGVFHLAAYLALRPDVAFVWHLYPAMLVAVVGLLLLVGFGLERLPKSAAVAGIVASTCVFSWGALVFSVEYPDMVWYGVRDRVDHDLSAYLRANASPGDIVDSEEVGTVAYLTDLAMLDHRGLVTRAERAGLDRAHFHDAHCRALAAIPRLRFLVMSPVEIPFHRCLYGHRPLVGFDGLGADGRVWALWVVDRLAL